MSDTRKTAIKDSLMRSTDFSPRRAQQVATQVELALREFDRGRQKTTLRTRAIEHLRSSWAGNKLTAVDIADVVDMVLQEVDGGDELLWVVARYEHLPMREWQGAPHGETSARWMEVLPQPLEGFSENVIGPPRTWQAPTAGDAFRMAVLENPRERGRAASYRVLPFTGGATFNVAMNVEGEGH